MRKVWIVAVPFLLAGCGDIPDPASEVVHKVSKTPKLISYWQRLKEQGNERGSVLGSGEWVNGALKLNDYPDNIALGDYVTVHEEILNQGPQSKGVKVLITGSAVDKGLVTCSKPIEIQSYHDLPDNKIPGGFGIGSEMYNHHGADWDKFSTNAVPMPNGYVAMFPDLNYSTMLELRLDLTSAKAGTGSVTISVLPADPSGSSDVKIKRQIKVEAIEGGSKASATGAPESVLSGTSTGTSAGASTSTSTGTSTEAPNSTNSP